MNISRAGKTLIALSLFVIFLSFGDTMRYISPFVNLAAPTSASSYGEQLGQTVDDVVNTIHATVPNSHITHADVLAIMCMEQGGANPSLQTRITSSAGAKGLTQVMPGTFSDYQRTGLGGFRHLQCNYAQIQTNPRCAIEAGARIFNELLIRYNGNRTTAARAYNGGPGRAHSATLPRETQQYAYVKLPECMTAILASQAPVRSTVWQAMIQKVSSLTNGTFRLLGDGRLVPLDSSGWSNLAANPQTRLQQITSGWFSNNNGSNNPNPISSFLGLPQTSQQIPQTPPGYLNPATNPGLNPGNDSSQRSSNSTGSSGTSVNSPAGNTVSSSGSGSGDPNDLGAIDFLSPANSTQTSTPTPQNKTKTIHNATPTLLCLPSPLAAGEEALILWACRDAAQTTSGENFDTGEKLIGTTRVSPTSDTTYTLECENDIEDIDNTAASCVIEVSNPAIAVIATPSSVPRGQTTTLSWKTKDISSCVLTSDTHSSFERRGTEGDVTSPALTRNTTFTVMCETATGAIEEKSIVVGVN